MKKNNDRRYFLWYVEKDSQSKNLIDKIEEALKNYKGKEITSIEVSKFDSTKDFSIGEMQVVITDLPKNHILLETGNIKYE